MTASSHFAQGNSADLPCYEILCSGILNVPLPYGMHLKVNPEGRHIFERLRPQQHRSAVDVMRDSRGWSLSIPFLRFSGSGAWSSPLMVLLSLHKVVLLWYCFCMWLPCRKRDVGTNTSTRWVSWENCYSWTKKKFWLRKRWKVVLVRSLLVVINLFSCIEQLVGEKNQRQILLSMPRWRIVWLIPFLDMK
jgi:hypothetical protein